MINEKKVFRIRAGEQFFNLIKIRINADVVRFKIYVLIYFEKKILS